MISIDRISQFFVPLGVETSTDEPNSLPISAFAIGEAIEIRPVSKSAS